MGRQIFVPSGKVIGGSSSINGMVHVRGNPDEFDRWSNQGCEGWDYKSVLPYFKRSETYHGPRNTLRGNDGPLSVFKTTPVNPLDVAFIESGVQAGFRLSKDFNGVSQEGFGSYDHSIDQRSAGQCRNRISFCLPRIDLISRLFRAASVEKIQIKGGRAVAVNYQTHSKVTTLMQMVRLSFVRGQSGRHTCCKGQV